MILLTTEDLYLCELHALLRLATALGVCPPGPFASERAQRGETIKAIMRAEARLAKLPRQTPDGVQPKPRGRSRRRAHR